MAMTLPPLIWTALAWLGNLREAPLLRMATVGAIQSPQVQAHNSNFVTHCECGQVNPCWQHIWTCFLGPTLRTFFWPVLSGHPVLSILACARLSLRSWSSFGLFERFCGMFRGACHSKKIHTAYLYSIVPQILATNFGLSLLCPLRTTLVLGAGNGSTGPLCGVTLGWHEARHT